MYRQRVIWLAIGLLLLTALACNAFAGAEPTLPSPPTVAAGSTAVSGVEETATPDQVAPTATVVGETTLEQQPGEPSEPTVTVLVNLNVRRGPGVQYDIVGFLLEGSESRIIGTDPGSGWWKISCPSSVTETDECWVSGGAAYSEAANTDGVPIAEIPPTPTPAPTEPDPNSGMVAYAVNGRLFIVSFDLSTDPPTAGEPVELASGNVQQAFISPDGRRVAYIASSTGNVLLNVINIDGSEENNLVSSEDLSVQVSNDSTLVASVDHVQWLADSRTLAFNTTARSLVGPGLGSQQDLWAVAIDGEPIQRLDAGEGAGIFAISADNKVILSQESQIVRVNLDGSQRETVINFEFINTASEYIYYPIPYWTPDGSYAYIAIPSREQFVPDATATLWRVPANGAAERLGEAPGTTLFTPILWSANGNVLGYVLADDVGDDTLPLLALANGAGQNATSYITAETLIFYGWSRNERNFLYATDELYAIGQIGTTPIGLSLPAGQRVVDAQWVTDDVYVVATGSNEGGATLAVGNLSGATNVLSSLDSVIVRFDVWSRE